MGLKDIVFLSVKINFALLANSAYRDEMSRSSAFRSLASSLFTKVHRQSDKKKKTHFMYYGYDFLTFQTRLVFK